MSALPCVRPTADSRGLPSGESDVIRLQGGELGSTAAAGSGQAPGLVLFRQTSNTGLAILALGDSPTRRDPGELQLDGRNLPYSN